MKSDSDFYNKVKEIEKSTIDYVESKLMELIRSEHPGSIMFFLKCKGGYVEPAKTIIQTTKDEAEILINQMINHVILVVSKHVVDQKQLNLISDELKAVPGNNE